MSQNLIHFESWPDVLSYARTSEPLYYQAPLDRYATQLYAGKDPPGYEVKARTIRIYPPGSAGRGRNRTSDPFNADAGHLERFSRPADTELRERGGRRVADDSETRTVELYNLFRPGSRSPSNGFLVRVVSNGRTRFVKFGRDERAARAFARGETPEPSNEEQKRCENGLREAPGQD